MRNRSDALLIRDMIENIEAIFQFAGEAGFEEVIADRQKIYAIVRAFEIIGEAAKGVSEVTKVAYPLVEWRQMTDFRNLLIHEYFGIDYEILWSVVKDMLPANLEMLRLIEI